MPSLRRNLRVVRGEFVALGEQQVEVGERISARQEPSTTAEFVILMLVF